MTGDPQAKESVRAAELIALIAHRAVNQGPTHSVWPGLTFYRFEQKISPRWDEVGSVSLGMVAQGRKRVRIGSANYFYDPFHYLVMTRGLRFQAEILQASPENPFLSFVLQVHPDLVTEVHDTINRLVPAPFFFEPVFPKPDMYVTALDQPLVSAVQRFLMALESEADRRVLAPMFLREIVYRLLRSEQHARLLDGAVREIQGNAITAAIAFMKLELHRTLTIRDLAEAVSMSESGFAHVFKATTGESPLQFLKQLRMEQASKFLLSGLNVSEAANSVGYASLSHFISEFKRYFGEPPKVYAQRLWDLQTAAIRDMSNI